MDPIKRIGFETSSVALQLTGLAYKIQQGGKITQEQLKTLNELTDKICSNMEGLQKEAASIENKMISKTQRLETLSKENAICKRKLAETRLEADELGTQAVS